MTTIHNDSAEFKKETTFDLTIVDLAGVDLTDADEVKAFAEKLGEAKTQSKVFETVSNLAFAVGRAHRSKNRCPNFRVVYDAFAAKYFSEANGRKPLKKISANTYASTFAAYTELGHKSGYDGKAVADYVTANIRGFTSRGAIIRTIMTEFPDIAPSTDEMAPFVPTKDRTVLERLKAIHKQLVNIEKDQDARALFDADADQARAFRNLMTASANLVEKINTSRGKE
jgi:hypothetical protein